MSADDKKFDEKVERATIVLVDVAGTTTSISFVKVGFFQIILNAVYIFTYSTNIYKQLVQNLLLFSLIIT